MKRAVLTRRERSYPYARKYISKENPVHSTEDINAAFLFNRIADARNAKKALRLRRDYGAHPMPGWFAR